MKEINSEIISVELAYTAEINKKDYEVNEFYRIRYSSSRIYLLSYQRTVESRFSLADVDFKEKEINLGMTSENPDVTVSDNGERMSFVADGSLWYYNMKDNKAYSVFSFMDSDQDYEREGYDQHNIRILNVRDNGEVNFLVYGYMNRGDYEGKLGIILYRFYEKEDRIEEMLFIPVTQNYEALESTLDKFSYLSGQDIYYFSMNNVIYAYNIITKAKQEIASNIAKNSFVLSDTGHFIAWQDSNQIKNSTAITMLNLETGERKKIKAGSGERIRVLGTVDVNLIYGFVDSSKVSTKADGSTFTPIKKIELMSNVGTVVKKYEKSNYYVTKVQVNDNVIELTRVKEGLSGYEKAKADFIMTKIPEESIIVTVKDKKKDKHISERVITLPDALKIKKNPSVVTAKNTVITMDTVLHLSDSETSGKQYYVVALGHVQNSYDQAGDAIKKADSLMGVVVDAEGNVIWERGEMNASGNVATVTAIHTSNIVNAKGAVTAMLLKAAGQSANAENLSKKSDSLYSLINKNVKGGAINLTGSNLEQALYYVSKGRPVVALKDNKQPVLITKYDSFNVTFIDPSTHTVKKMGRNSATAYFKSAGNVFISYIN